MNKLSYIHNAHPQFIESMYAEYQKDPDSIEQGWRQFFEGFELGVSSDGKGQQQLVPDHIEREIRVLNLIQAYRSRDDRGSHGSSTSGQCP